MLLKGGKLWTFEHTRITGLLRDATGNPKRMIKRAQVSSVSLSNAATLTFNFLQPKSARVFLLYGYKFYSWVKSKGGSTQTVYRAFSRFQIGQESQKKKQRTTWVCRTELLPPGMNFHFYKSIEIIWWNSLQGLRLNFLIFFFFPQSFKGFIYATVKAAGARGLEGNPLTWSG